MRKLQLKLQVEIFKMPFVGENISNFILNKNQNWADLSLFIPLALTVSSSAMRQYYMLKKYSKKLRKFE